MRQLNHVQACLQYTRTSLAFGLLIVAILSMLCRAVDGQQRANDDFQVTLENPRFETSSGPRVVIDGAHENFHTVDGRYQAFAAVLRADGYRVTGSQDLFSRRLLDEIDILVIANALHESNASNWRLPTPSAFTDEEIDQLVAWIDQGGSLFLIADHMPFPGAAASLAEKFGVEMINGFAFEREGPDGELLRQPIIFQRDEGAIGNHAITDSNSHAEPVTQVASFTGQAMVSPDHATVLLRFTKPTVVLSPQAAWQFDTETTTRDAEDLAQGLALTHGSGRVVIFGEAAMFTSQKIGEASRTNGLTAEFATHNQQLLLNIAAWLSGAID